jgi:hypothetical protein
VAITTLDGALAGMRPPVPFFKTGVTMAAVAERRWYTPWYVTTGIPGTGATPAAGVNGGALSAPISGQLFRSNPTAMNAYLARLAAQSSVAGTLLIIDRLWANSGLVVTSTGAQAITPVALPARSADGTANGEGVLAAIEWRVAGGAGTPTVTLTYTDQSGNTGATAVFTGVASPPIGTFEVFGLAAGDTGIRAPTSFIQSATRTSGTMHLVLFRILAAIPMLAATPIDIDAVTGGFPQIFDSSVLQLVWINTATTGTTWSGLFTETHG